MGVVIFAIPKDSTAETSLLLALFLSFLDSSFWHVILGIVYVDDPNVLIHKNDEIEGNLYYINHAHAVNKLSSPIPS